MNAGAEMLAGMAVAVVAEVVGIAVIPWVPLLMLLLVVVVMVVVVVMGRRVLLLVVGTIAGRNFPPCPLDSRANELKMALGVLAGEVMRGRAMLVCVYDVWTCVCMMCLWHLLGAGVFFLFFFSFSLLYVWVRLCVCVYQ